MLMGVYPPPTWNPWRRRPPCQRCRQAFYHPRDYWTVDVAPPSTELYQDSAHPYVQSSCGSPSRPTRQAPPLGMSVAGPPSASSSTKLKNLPGSKSNKKMPTNAAWLQATELVSNIATKRLRKGILYMKRNFSKRWKKMCWIIERLQKRGLIRGKQKNHTSASTTRKQSRLFQHSKGGNFYHQE